LPLTFFVTWLAGSRNHVELSAYCFKAISTRLPTGLQGIGSPAGGRPIVSPLLHCAQVKLTQASAAQRCYNCTKPAATPSVTQQTLEGVAIMSKNKKKSNDEPELPFKWEQVQSAIWLIGIAIIALRGWWWPGMLVLVAISGLTQAAIAAYVERNSAREEAIVKQKNLEEARATALPEQCSGCGAPLDAKSVIWRSDTTASCPYCNTSIKAVRPLGAPQPQPAPATPKA
jgi:hypothetical protein